jgi:hypothetical protein
VPYKDPAKKAARQKSWRAANHRWYAKNRPYFKIYQRNYYRRLRDAVLIFLGGKCSNPDCRWLNEDGTFGCKDRTMLQVDHVYGGGYEERKKLKATQTIYQKVLKDTEGKYQLLCANCNWKKGSKKSK